MEPSEVDRLVRRSYGGQRIGYAAVAFLRCADGRLGAAWVLGDLDALRVQVES